MADVEERGSVFVQHQLCLTTPMRVTTLRRLLADAPDDATVDLLDGELIEVRWDRHEESGL